MIPFLMNNFLVLLQKHNSPPRPLSFLDSHFPVQLPPSLSLSLSTSHIFLYSSRAVLYSAALSSPWMSPLGLGASCPSPRGRSRLILASSLSFLFSIFMFYNISLTVNMMMIHTNCFSLTTMKHNSSCITCMFTMKRHFV